MVVPFFAQDFGAGPSVAGREGYAERVAQFAVEVRHGSLGPGKHADGNVAQLPARDPGMYPARHAASRIAGREYMEVWKIISGEGR